MYALCHFLRTQAHLMLAMSRKQYRCFVVGCKNEHNSLYFLPKSEPQKTPYISYVFDGNTPPNTHKTREGQGEQELIII